MTIPVAIVTGDTALAECAALLRHDAMWHAGRVSSNRASRIMLNGVSVARLTFRKPPAVMTSRNFAPPACAPSAAPTSCDNEVAMQPAVEAA